MQRIILFIMILYTLPAFSGETLTVPLSRPDEEGKLVINHYKGDVTITGYDGKVLLVNAAIGRNGLASFKHTDAKAIPLQATEDDNVVRVYTNSEDRIIDLDIRVPEGFSLDIKKSETGKITVRRVSGETVITNAEDDIVLSEIKGPAVISTIDGNITAGFESSTEPAPMAFTSVEGKIDVTFPADIQLLIKMRSEYGEIFTDFDIHMEEHRIDKEKSEKTGFTRISLQEWMRGSINGGGPEVLFKNHHGDIYIRSDSS